MEIIHGAAVRRRKRESEKQEYMAAEAFPSVQSFQVKH